MPFEKNNSASSLSVPHFLGRIVAIILVCELLVMLFVLNLEWQLSVMERAIVDAVMLSVISAPFLYFWVVLYFVRKAEQATFNLRASQQHLQSAQQLARLGSWQLDQQHNELVWSDEVFSIFEIDPQQRQVSYQDFIDSVHPDDRELVITTFQESLDKQTPYHIEHRILMADGRIKFISERGHTLYDDNGKPLRTIGTVLDITERRLSEEALRQSQMETEGALEKIAQMNLNLQTEIAKKNQMQDRLNHYAKHDPLTTLPNRMMLREKVEQLMQEVSASGSKLGCMFLDLTGIRSINDNFGHARGDEVLVEMALKLAGAIRPDDFICRLGGVEFIILSPGFDPADDSSYKQHLREVVRAPVETQANARLDIHVGSAIFPDDASGAIQLFAHADQQRREAVGSVRVKA